MPIKKENDEGFSLQIKSDSKVVNDLLNFLVTITINPRFQFHIKINSEVKLFDFDFLISSNNKEGFLNEKICCPIEMEDYFDFILYIGTSENRLCLLTIEKKFDENIIETTINDKIAFFCSIKLQIHVKLLKKQKTNIKLKAIIDNKYKEIEIMFDSIKNCKNFGYKLINRPTKKDDNSKFFSFIFNEITAHGINKKDDYNFMTKEIPKRKPGFIDLNQPKNNLILQLKEIDINTNINIKDICNFYSRMSEEARLLPIYYLIYKSEKPSSKNQKLIMKNFHILEKLYESLILDDNQNDEDKYYEENYFHEEINEFLKSFNYMKSIIEIHDKSKENLIKKIFEFIKNKDDIFDINNNFLKTVVEKFMNSEDVGKLQEYIKKLNINLDDIKNELEEVNINEIEKEFPLIKMPNPL